MAFDFIEFEPCDPDAGRMDNPTDRLLAEFRASGRHAVRRRYDDELELRRDLDRIKYRKRPTASTSLRYRWLYAYKDGPYLVLVNTEVLPMEVER